MTVRIAIAQIAMRWTLAENLAAITAAVVQAQSRGARIVGFAELAVTGFHREIAREAQPGPVAAALNELRTLAARLRVAIAVGAPAFAAGGEITNVHVLIDEQGQVAAVVPKHGLTAAEATFFARGQVRPVGRLQGLRCSAVICREVEDLQLIGPQLPPGTVDLVLVPGALRQDPAKPRTDPPAYVHDIRRLAAATASTVVHTNWPNALNRPEESVEGGGSTVSGPDGELLLRLPMQQAGIALFMLGERQFEWVPEGCAGSARSA